MCCMWFNSNCIIIFFSDCVYVYLCMCQRISLNHSQVSKTAQPERCSRYVGEHQWVFFWYVFWFNVLIHEIRFVQIAITTHALYDVGQIASWCLFLIVYIYLCKFQWIFLDRSQWSKTAPPPSPKGILTNVNRYSCFYFDWMNSMMNTYLHIL